jgi:hypothetical protein
MEISWTDRVRNEEVLQRVKEERNVLYTVKRMKAIWVGHILRLKHVIEGNIERGMESTEKKEEDVSSYRMTLRKSKVIGN